MHAPAGQAAREGIVSHVQRVREMIHAGQHGCTEELAVVDHAAHRHAAKTHPVIALFASDQAHARGVAAGALIGDGDLERRVHGFRAGVGEKYPVHARRRYLGEPGREFEGERMAHLERRRELHGAQLAPHRVGDLAPAVTGVHAPQPRDPIEHLATVRGPVMHPFGPRQQPRIRLELPIGGERHPECIERVARRGGRCVVRWDGAGLGIHGMTYGVDDPELE